MSTLFTAAAPDLRDRIRQALIKFESTRDSDELLACAIWARELNAAGYDIKHLSTRAFFDIFANNKGAISNYKTIERIRRKLQENDKSLRGRKYAARKLAEEQTRDLFSPHNTAQQ